MLFSTLRQGRRADIVHANWSIAGAIAGIAGLLTGTPVVTTLRGEDVTRVRRAGLYRMLLWICLRLSIRVAAVSQALAAEVSGLFPNFATKISIIPNGVNSEGVGFHRNREDARCGVVTVGSLIPRKDIGVLLEAFSRVPERSKMRLTVIGDGIERPRLEMQAEQLGLSQQVVFRGQLAPHTVTSVLAQHDIFVLTSKSEGRSNALLEAMALGLAPIATKIDGVTELLDHGVNGLLFTVGDTDALARHLQLLAQDSDKRCELGEAARMFIERSELRWERTAKQYFELYQLALSEQAGYVRR